MRVLLWIRFVATLDELADLGARAFRYALVERVDDLLAARNCLLESMCGDGKVEERGNISIVYLHERLPEFTLVLCSPCDCARTTASSVPVPYIIEKLSASAFQFGVVDFLQITFSHLGAGPC